jgi:alkylated DNA repair dioxygenase AlkB
MKLKPMPTQNKKIQLNEGGILDYYPEFLDQEKATNLLNVFINTVAWEQKLYTNFKGEKFPQPRLTAWFADNENLTYSYSKVTQIVQPWTNELLALKEVIEDCANFKYNSVLLNYYRNGKDSVGMHSDNEKELGLNANIASLSLGATRTFNLSQFKSNSNPAQLGFEQFKLTNGSLLIMAGTTQQFWKHSVPKDLNCDQPRINLTFRKIIKD